MFFSFLVYNIFVRSYVNMYVYYVYYINYFVCQIRKSLNSIGTPQELGGFRTYDLLLNYFTFSSYLFNVVFNITKQLLLICVMHTARILVWNMYIRKVTRSKCKYGINNDNEIEAIISVLFALIRVPYLQSRFISAMSS